MSYKELEKRFKRIDTINRACAVLDWDRATLMPDGCNDDRSNQLAELGVISHDMLTATEIGDLISKAKEDTELTPWQNVNLDEMAKAYRKATVVSSDLVDRQTRIHTSCEMAWKEARKNSDFKSIIPNLQEMIDVTNEVAEVMVPATGARNKYDALIDGFEAGGTSENFDKIFNKLQGFLPSLTQEIIERQNTLPPILSLTGSFSKESQKELAEKLMRIIGFDFNKGRLDESEHPFTTGSRDDVRITTTYHTNDFLNSLTSVTHETGHAMYELGLPKEWSGQPVGNACGMVLHESQSLLLDLQVCRGIDFLTHATPIICNVFGKNDAKVWNAYNIHRNLTSVKSSFIRIEADEVTYPLHVALRYKLERAMISGDLQVKDLPGAWNDGMKDLLGIVPKNDAEGCLQDIHWYCGLWGYFPTYTLGAIAAAQIFAAVKRAVPNVQDEIRGGNFDPLYTWLRHNIHSRGSFGTTDTILYDSTGSDLDTVEFEAYLKERYLK